MTNETLTTKGNEMTKTELKKWAQDEILDVISHAFYRNEDSDELTNEEKTERAEALDKQMRRIEKMYEYAPGSWGRF